MKLVFNCCGADTLVFVEPAAPLKEARNEALIATRAPVRDMALWEVRTRDGAVLDPAMQVGKLPLQEGSNLFIRLADDAD